MHLSTRSFLLDLFRATAGLIAWSTSALHDANLLVLHDSSTHRSSESLQLLSLIRIQLQYPSASRSCFALEMSELSCMDALHGWMNEQ